MEAFLYGVLFIFYPILRCFSISVGGDVPGDPLQDLSFPTGTGIPDRPEQRPQNFHSYSIPKSHLAKPFSVCYNTTVPSIF